MYCQYIDFVWLYFEKSATCANFIFCLTDKFLCVYMYTNASHCKVLHLDTKRSQITGFMSL